MNSPDPELDRTESRYNGLILFMLGIAIGSFLTLMVIGFAVRL